MDPKAKKDAFSDLLSVNLPLANIQKQSLNALKSDPSKQQPASQLAFDSKPSNTNSGIPQTFTANNSQKPIGNLVPAFSTNTNSIPSTSGNITPAIPAFANFPNQNKPKNDNVATKQDLFGNLLGDQIIDKKTQTLGSLQSNQSKTAALSIVNNVASSNANSSSPYDNLDTLLISDPKSSSLKPNSSQSANIQQIPPMKNQPYRTPTLDFDPFLTPLPTASAQPPKTIPLISPPIQAGNSASPSGNNSQIVSDVWDFDLLSNSTKNPQNIGAGDSGRQKKAVDLLSSDSYANAEETDLLGGHVDVNTSAKNQKIADFNEGPLFSDKPSGIFPNTIQKSSENSNPKKMQDVGAINNAAKSIAQPKDELNSKVNSITALGYDENLAQWALNERQGNVNLAIELLISQQQEQEAAKSRTRAQSANEEITGSNTGGSGMTLTKEALLGTAKEIGTNVLSKAKGFFEFSKKFVGELAEQINNTGSDAKPRGTNSERFGDSDDREPDGYRFYKDENDFNSREYRADFQTTDSSRSRYRRDDSSNFQADLKTQPTPELQPFNKPGNVKEGDLLNGNSIPQVGSNPILPPSIQKSIPKPIEVYATPEQVATSESHKSVGNDAFKRGQFHEAAESYTKAIGSLPPKHQLLLALYNNRAGSYLKTGEYRNCIEDANYVLNVEPSNSKALLRRATAYEALEDFKSAINDYRILMGIAPSPAISSGLSRCKNALEPAPTPVAAPISNTVSGSNSASKGMPLSAAETSRINEQVNAAVDKIRDANLKEEAESDEKLKLKDQIEATVQAWAKGKEDNIRALISSLESILWPECQWKPITLGSLITPQQVKIAYMKAVAKVHPDKLQQGASVSQKMTAALIFSQLNKAWESFKLQAGL